MLQCFFFTNPQMILLKWDFTSLYYLPLLYLSPPCVDQMADSFPYPISTFLKSLDIAVRLNSTVQVSPPHKCGQIISYKAFNAVVVAFRQIFLTFFFPYPFLMLIPTNRIAQNVVPNFRPILLTSALLSRCEIRSQTYFLEL